MKVKLLFDHKAAILSFFLKLFCLVCFLKKQRSHFVLSKLSIKLKSYFTKLLFENVELSFRHREIILSLSEQSGIRNTDGLLHFRFEVIIRSKVITLFEVVFISKAIFIFKVVISVDVIFIF